MSSNIEKELDFAPYEIEETKQQKVDAMEAQYKKTFTEMTAKIALLELEKQAAVAIGVKALAQVAKAGAPAAVTPGSGKKPNYTAAHPTRHDAVVLATAPALLALKQLQNNHDAIWWCAKHIEALGVGDKPDWHKSYKDWASPYKNDALDLYIPFVEGTPAAGSP
jgi:hypothetical protein